MGEWVKYNVGRENLWRLEEHGIPAISHVLNSILQYAYVCRPFGPCRRINPDIVFCLFFFLSYGRVPAISDDAPRLKRRSHTGDLFQGLPDHLIKTSIR